MDRGIGNYIQVEYKEREPLLWLGESGFQTGGRRFLRTVHGMEKRTSFLALKGDDVSGWMQLGRMHKHLQIPIW